MPCARPDCPNPDRLPTSKYCSRRCANEVARATARPSRSPAIDAVADRLGVLSDAEVAKLAGVTRAAVRAYRKRRGVAAAFNRGGRPKPRVSTPTWAWSLRIATGKGEVVRFVLATDARAASALGEPFGQVVGVERLGEAIVPAGVP